MNKYLLILLFYLLGTQLIAQSSCERNLNEARADYSNGNLYAIPGKLANCLEEGFNKTEKIDALRLLTLTYININQQEKARNTFIKLLNLKTDFQVQENVDPSELYSLYRKIDTDVKYFIGVTFGFNYNTIFVHKYRNTNPNPIEPDHTAKYKTGIIPSPQVGIQFLYPLTKNWIVGAEAQYQNQRFNYSEKNTYLIGENTENFNDNYTDIEYDATNNGLNLIINMRYMKDFYEWKPFIEVGTVGRYNLSYNVIRYESDYFPTVEDEVIDEKIDISSKRANFNVAVSANLGTMRKVGENYVEIKFGVSNYFINHLNPEGRETAYTEPLLKGMSILNDDITNLVYKLSFTFNIPFFNFQ
ncbi:outer membrane beta-barrel protein [Marivirga salinae]|uniref:Outer membrane beta-barrel protein n=1 Tax=Marivirga salinarum TaxID=3059078 RepID=A0AA51R8L6_9BACT|nr:outer membrane beta-barrel protein [Marivirga sp. BDSF4-3]WMN11342.1 outer membrane beta-barrel protein [Marivirga sp. BDSF4-3]